MTNKKSGGLKVFYLIFSIIVAIALWIYVAYVENPTVDEPVAISGIKVELEGEEILRESNLIVTDVDVERLTIYFGGRIRDVSRLSNTNVKAVVDLKDILQYTSPTGIHSLNYTLVYEESGNSVVVERMSRPVIEVTVERLVTEMIPLSPVFKGSIADNYMAGELTLSRSSVEVAGTEAAIDKIASATVTLEGEAVSKTFTREESIVLLDADGNEINMEEEGLSFLNGVSTAMITQNILMVRDIPLVVDIIECSTATDANISRSITPSTITLSGDPEVLEGLNTINLGTIDLKSFVLSYSETYQIRIPNDAKNLSGITTATVTIEVLGMSTRRISVSNISTRNGTGEISIITQSLDVTLRGSEQDINAVLAENVRIVADLSDYANMKGTFTVNATVYVDGFPNVDAVGTYPLNVTIE